MLHLNVMTDIIVLKMPKVVLKNGFQFPPQTKMCVNLNGKHFKWFAKLVEQNLLLLWFKITYRSKLSSSKNYSELGRTWKQLFQHHKISLAVITTSTQKNQSKESLPQLSSQTTLLSCLTSHFKLKGAACL